MQTKLSSIPVIPMRGIVTLPGEEMTFDVGRSVSIKAVERAGETDGGVILLCQKDPMRTNITSENMYTAGTYCSLSKVVDTTDAKALRVTVKAVSRVEITELLNCDTYFAADVILHTDDELDDETADTLKRILTEQVRLVATVKTIEVSQTDIIRAGLSQDHRVYCDSVASLFVRRTSTKQRVLEEFDLIKRYELVCELLANERKVAEVDKKIDSLVRQNIDKNQREYYLREKIGVIKHELGDDSDAELEQFRKRASEKDLPEYAKERLNKEIKRLETLPGGSHEAPTTRGLIECILDLPWTEKTTDNTDIAHARSVLDRDHYGLSKVKDRIIEYLSVAERTKSLGGQILCLVGPPGVGKTSIVSSIAQAVGRSFVRMSLGGIDDEAEIRGHRRTYIGAMPGRIITAMRQAKTVNPVLLFDEIDKLNKNIHGDPAAAMLEVLDSAQNSTFRDHYLEIPYDLSQVMFITTANSTDTIPRPLLDRMEIIEVPGYLEYEKVQIALRHLLPKQLEKHGLSASELSVSEDAAVQMIRGYTHESGVRTLERIMAKICRKASCELHEGKTRLSMTNSRIVKYLGTAKYTYDMADKEPQVGVVNGLAWTSVGGETLSVEVMPIPGGSGKTELTGSLGDVMKESARAALTFVRANAADYGVADDFFSKHDIHIHVPEGAVPKDGPSAGITLMTAIMSAVSGIPVVPQLAMTGEITLRGNVLKIGGLREKLLAAIRAGITTAVVPLENKSDVEEMEDEIRKNIRVVYVSTADEVLKKALMSREKLIHAGLSDCTLVSPSAK